MIFFRAGQGAALEELGDRDTAQVVEMLTANEAFMSKVQSYERRRTALLKMQVCTPSAPPLPPLCTSPAPPLCTSPAPPCTPAAPRLRTPNSPPPSPPRYRRPSARAGRRCGCSRPWRSTG